MTVRNVEGYISCHTDMVHTSLRDYFLGGTASTVTVGQLVPTFEAVFFSLLSFVIEFPTFCQRDMIVYTVPLIVVSIFRVLHSEARTSQGQDVAYLSPSPATSGPSDQSAGQPNCREQRGHQPKRPYNKPAGI